MNQTAEFQPLWRRLWNRPGVRGMSLVPTVLAYWLLVRFVERRKVGELAANKFLTHSAVGWLVGMGIMLVATGAMAAFGAYRVDGINADAYLLGPLLGIPVSGFDVKGLLSSHTQGPELISGGEFGAEASILTLVVCVSLGLFFARKAIAEGKILKPSWRRPLQSTTGPQ